MGFGFAIGDVVAVGDKAWAVSYTKFLSIACSTDDCFLSCIRNVTRPGKTTRHSGVM